LATFKFGRYIDIHWNGYDIQGPADTVFSIPDQLYEEFDSDIAPVEPTLQWIDINEFQTLSNSVSAATLSATAPITIASTSTGRIISFSSGTTPNGYLLSSDGAGGSIWNPASTSGLTSVVGVSPISSAVSGGVVSVSLNANYQTAGTYVTGVVGTSPISASGTTSITVTIDQTALTAGAATTAEGLRTYVKNTSGSAMTKGQAVYVNGAEGTNVTIQLATASTEAGSSKVLGLLYQGLANNEFGWVVESGYLGGIDTSAATAGDSVWLDNTPGSLVFGAPPAEPSNSVYLGVVARSNNINGEILVKVQNGYEIDELHDVSAASPSDGDIIQYKTSSAMWTKSSIAGAGIAASIHTHDYQVSGNYQTAGTYVNAVIGTSPASVSTTSGTATVSISSGSATNGQVLTANGSGGVNWSTTSQTINIGAFVQGTATFSFGTSDNSAVTFTPSTNAGNAATIGIGGGGSVILRGSRSDTATTSKTWETFTVPTTYTTTTQTVVNSATISPSPAGSIQADGLNALRAHDAASTAVYWTERWSTTTAGSVYASMRKYNTTLTTSIWNTVIFGPGVNQGWPDSFNPGGSRKMFRPIYQPDMGCWLGHFDYGTATTVGTAQVFSINDASGSIIKANFGVNSATEGWTIVSATYVPPLSGGDGTVWAIGFAGIPSTGGTLQRRVAYTATSSTLVAASTVDNMGPLSSIFSTFLSGRLAWDSTINHIVYDGTGANWVAIDRTFGTAVQTSNAATLSGNTNLGQRDGGYNFWYDSNPAVYTEGTVINEYFSPVSLGTAALVNGAMQTRSNGTVNGFVPTTDGSVTGSLTGRPIGYLRYEKKTILSSVPYNRMVWDTNVAGTDADGSALRRREMNGGVSLISSGSIIERWMPANTEWAIIGTPSLTSTVTAPLPYKTVRMSES